MAPMAFNDADLLGMTEEEIDAQCDELFEEAPIAFEPEETSDLNEAIES